MKKLLLIDLGGVLIDLNWETSIKKLFLENYSEKNWHEKWASLDSLRKLETGAISFEDFLVSFKNEIQTERPLAEVKDSFMGLIGGLKPGCLECLKTLKESFELAMLSNTSAPHIEKVKTYPGFLELFDFRFYSFNLGILKPAAKVFEIVCQETHRTQKEIIFFDDSQTNVEGAKKIGMKAFRVDSIVESIPLLSL